MLRSYFRRVLIVASVATVAAGSASAIASAEPAPAPQLPAQLVDAVARDLHLTPDAYLGRAALGQQLARFAEVARTQFPASFAGAWLDSAGAAIVGLADGPDTGAARSAAEGAGFTVTSVARSEISLRTEAADLGTQLATAAPAVADAVRGISIDTVGNRLAVRLSNAASGVPLPPQLEAARVFFAPEPVDAPLVSVAENLPSDAALGGDGYNAVSATGGFQCSLGFNGTDAVGNTVNISAGHCDPNLPAAGTDSASEARTPNGSRFGTFTRTSLTDHDFSVIRIDDNARNRFENNEVRVPGAAPVGITGTADPVVGAPVCKSGSTTGFTCGTVSAVDQSVRVGQRTLTESFSTNICALQGDSGGTIITGTLALGVSSASNVGPYVLCDIANFVTLLSGETPELYATPINAILRDNPGLTVRTS